jgi:serine/threonine-protein kinase
MAKREKFGKFVLLDEVESSGLGVEHRAAKLGATGLEKIVALLRLGPELSRNPDFARNLMDQAKLAAQLQNANIAKIYGIGKVDASYYISYEFVEGKSLKGIFTRCRRDGFPFSVDHTLLIASKICSALEYAHGRKTDAGIRYFHGLVNPASVFVSYEGEVRVRGFGYWPSKVREAGAVREDEMLYLSPEQAAGGPGDTRSDTFAVGAILYETLTGQALFQDGRAIDVPARLSAAKLQSPSGDDDQIPKAIADILARALAQDPAGRYAEIAEMRKAIDTLLFSGDFTPTTFNLAFFMHSLFREDIDKESKQLKDEKEASYAEFLVDDKAAAKTSPAAPSLTPVPVSAPVAHPVAHAPAPVHAPTPTASHEPPPPPAASAKEAASGFTFHKEEPKKGSTPLVAGGALVVLLLAAGGWYLFGRGPRVAVNTAPPTTTLSPEALAAQAHVKELEDKLKAFEAEKAEAEAKAAEEAKKKLEAQAKALGVTADPAAIAKAQEDAAKKARLEQEKKQQEEKKKLEDAKAAEEARLAEEHRKAEEARLAALAAATTTLPPTTTVPPTTQPALKAGTLVNLSDIGVTPPVPDKTPPLVYPPIALRQRIEGTVELSILVDERGVVTDTQVVTSAGGRSGLDEAAIENAKKRKYRPATKEGLPVKVWMPLRVQFKLPS